MGIKTTSFLFINAILKWKKYPIIFTYLVYEFNNTFIYFYVINPQIVMSINHGFEFLHSQRNMTSKKRNSLALKQYLFKTLK